MTASTNAIEFTVHDAFAPDKYEPFIVGRVQWLRRPGDGNRPALSAGFWHVTLEEAPEPFDLVIEADETIHIIEGHLHIDVVDGDTFDLKPGSAASFNKGTRTRWTVVETTTEFFVYS
ncbi:cupin domain-containing protein [Arthrobacter oryzae]|uniref:cupin domain-containing protein n=1 Tax=Arthrobacter oryzae TaxID=409290 RepID=UPI0028655855|nr:cupin domain-containing protein [Arthrobacter oryzae]MDR6505737.1 putative cupin superfamily protein [Arthrobacter oryzae]